jgi:hypothetical protein
MSDFAHNGIHKEHATPLARCGNASIAAWNVQVDRSSSNNVYNSAYTTRTGVVDLRIDPTALCFAVTKYNKDVSRNTLIDSIFIRFYKKSKALP